MQLDFFIQANSDSGAQTDSGDSGTTRSEDFLSPTHTASTITPSLSTPSPHLSSSLLSQLFEKLSDRELDQVTRLKARHEQETTLDLLLHLKAIEARRVYSLLAYSSLWEYCVKGLGYSESAASERVAAMRLLKKNPEVEYKLRDGQLNLATAAQLHRFFQAEEKAGTVVAPAQKSALIEQAAGHSKREVEKLLLTESFKNRGYSIAGSSKNSDRTTTTTDTRNSTVNTVGTSAPLPKHFKETTRLITPELTELKLYADEELIELLNRMKELRGPDQSHLELFKAAIRVYLEKKDPLIKSVRISKKATQDSRGKISQLVTISRSTPAADATHAPDKACPINNSNAAGETLGNSIQADKKIPARSRYIPAAIRQKLFARSGGQCEYHDPQTNARCRCKTRLEIEHTQPFALGGRHTLSNLKIYCAPHNQWAAVKIFGEIQPKNPFPAA